MSKRKNTHLFPVIVSVFLLLFAFCPKVEAVDYLNICSQNGSQLYPASAWNNSEQAEYLTVWYNDQDPNQGIYGVRLNADGNFKGSSSPYKIAASKGGSVYRPSVACNPQKNQYLVTWQDQAADNPSFTSIYAVFVSFDATGKIKINPITGLPRAKEKPSSPKVAWNGEQYLMVWYDYSGTPQGGVWPANADIYGVRIDSSGAVLDPDGIKICTAGSAQTDPAITPYHKSAGGVEERGWLVAWVDERDPSTGKDIYATIIKQDTDALTITQGTNFLVCKAQKDQKNLSAATGPEDFFIAWLDERLKDTSVAGGGTYGNLLYGARVSFDGKVLVNLNPYGAISMDILLAVLTPYEGRTPKPEPSAACIQNNYLVISDYKSQVSGTRVSLDGRVLDTDMQTGLPKPFIISDTHESAIMPSLAVFDSDRKALITWMQDTDISGSIYTLPKSPQLAWAETGIEGVLPDQGEGGSEFTFKVKYTKADDSDEPLYRIVQVDLNHNGILELNENFTLEKVSSGSTIYQKKIPVLFDGVASDPNSCILGYRFYFQDKYNAAEGIPTSVHTVKITPHGNVPQLTWQGEGGYIQDGIDPDYSTDDADFTFQVKYKDADNSAPSKYQVWIDLNGDTIFQDDMTLQNGAKYTEKFPMTKVGSGNFSEGVTYQYKQHIKVNRVGLVAYRFYFDDTCNVAQGNPKETNYLSITNVLEACIHSSSGIQKLPDIASTSLGSLVVWEDLRDARLVDQKLSDFYEGSFVYGTLLDSQGKKAARPEIRIANHEQSQFKPRVAASTSNNIYLVVWEDLRNGKAETAGGQAGIDRYGRYINTDIYGQIVDGDNPARQIDDVAIAKYTTSSASVNSNQQNPAVAAGADNKFLVVWEDGKTLDMSGKDIRGAIVSYNPADSRAKVNIDPNSNENYIIGQESDQTNPAVAWGGHSYLVVWQDYRAEADGEVNSHIYGNPVDPNGFVMAGYAPVKDNMKNGCPICINADFVHEHPAIASDGNKFLVVFEQKSTGTAITGKDIYGVLVGANGMTGQPFAICTAKGDQTSPRVVWDKTSSSYLVVWASQSFSRNAQGELQSGNETDIRGTRIDAAGKLLGSSAAGSAGWEICTLQGMQDAPAISGNEHLNQVVWADSRSYQYAASYGSDIYAVPFKSFLNWVEDDGFFYGVSPASAGNGKYYTFKINYVNIAGGDPKVSKVGVDLDGDGIYSEQEKNHDLSVDSSDTNPADGKAYSASIPLTLPANYSGYGWISYRFYFEDADSAPVAGSANQPEIVQINSPRVDFVTGEPNYQATAVYPTSGTPGTTFEFRVLYTYQPSDPAVTNLWPDTAQLWIDLNQDGEDQSGEKKDLEVVDQNDTNYTDGKKYSYKFKGDQKGTYRYRFYFKNPDGGVAIGVPAQDHTLIIGDGGSTPPTTTYPTWTTYTKPDIAEDYVTSLAIRDNTVLWAGTTAGLSRFDGSSWSATTAEKESNLASSYITAMTYDSISNILYVGTSKGLSSYDGTVWKKYDKGTTGGVLGGNIIWALAFDKVNQKLWIASVVGSQATSYGLMPGSLGQSGLSGSQSRFLGTDPNNSALIQYNPSADTWTAYNTQNTGGGLPSNYIMTLAVDRSGDVWVSTIGASGSTDKAEYKGLSRFKPEQNKWIQYTTTSNNDGGILKTNYILNVVEDEHKNLWVAGAPESNDADAAEGGLYRFDLQNNRWADHFYKGKAGVNMGSNVVTALAVDADGTGIWVATCLKEDSGKMIGKGVSLYDGSSSWKLFTTENTEKGLADNYITTIAVQPKDGEDKDGKKKKDVWFGTTKGLSRYGSGPGDSNKPASNFDANDRFAFPGQQGCFVNSLAHPLNQNSPLSRRSPWSGWIFLVIGLLGIGIAPIYGKEISMGKKVVAIVILLFLLSAPLVARAESIRKGTFLELKGGFYRPTDSENWETAFGRTFSAFGGLKLSREILKNIELGLSTDYMHAIAREWSVYYIPMGLGLTYAMRYSQNQFIVPYLGGGVDYVYGKTGRLKQSDIAPTYLKENGYHAVAGIRLLLDALADDDASAFDQKFGVNNSYLVLEARYLKLFNADYADEPLPAGEPGTGYLDPRGMFISLGILLEF